MKPRANSPSLVLFVPFVEHIFNAEAQRKYGYRLWAIGTLLVQFEQFVLRNLRDLRVLRGFSPSCPSWIKMLT
ncbi:hypothetical protein JOD20_000518 [Herpetosiphon giganteus]|nr:hypothetical protein [Herpetosiphon giganteus]